MADVEEPQYNTLKERIAALNQQKNFNGNGAEAAARKPPPPPPGPSRSHTSPAPITNGHTSAPVMPQRPVPKAKPPPLPRRDTGASVASSQAETPGTERRGPPPLPNRTASSTSQPGLPRRTSTQYLHPTPSERRGSTSSDLSLRSVASNVSSASGTGPNGRFKVPPAYDQGSLPPLPPSRRDSQAKTQKQVAVASRPTPPPSTKSDTNVNSLSALVPARPSLPPRLPSRPATTQAVAKPELPRRTTNGTASPQPAQPAKMLPVMGFGTKPQANPTSQTKPRPIMGFGSGSGSKNKASSQTQQQEERPAIPSRPSESNSPPPVPMTSRPSASQIEAASTRTAADPGSAVSDDCWVCRDWSGPDGIAAQFPRQQLPKNDPVGHLARGLCDPFPSYTDKARAIFTWFHHNISYDTVSFFGKCVKHMSVEDTIFSGLAVCQGYAETYKAIANRAGLDCVMVVGHGKGFGHTALQPGERPPPPKPDGHAWNAVRIDSGAWQLLDACWGAGHICSAANLYKQKFSPEQFISSNEEFGERHFPKDPSQQFRNDGRTISWDEYFIGRGSHEKPTFYTTAHQEGLLENSLEPKEKHISVSRNETIRFQWSKICPHWRSETHGLGKPPLLFLAIHGVDGRKDDMVPIETDGHWSWCDVNARDLGAPGQPLQIAVITSIDGKDGRGLTAKEYFSKRGKVGMAWSYLIRWELVQ